ncbi:alcohol dehydrogenase [Xylogone sp. PMI_703]|nr:alcohol dehydrogenase [Xylogone sp. PMI_703]
MSSSTSKIAPAVTGPLLELNNGVKMPALGFGTFASQGQSGETYRAVMCALEAGYRHLDCAWFYQNEDEVGNAIKDFLSQNPDVKRSDIFVTTKVWNHLHAPEDVEWSLKNSLQKLQLDYVDAFLVHWPIAAERTEDYQVKLGPDGKYIINEELTKNPLPTWQAMERLYQAKLTRSIGVSNFTIAGLQDLLVKCSVPPAMNQIEIHPFHPQPEIIHYLTSHNILPVAYSPLGSQDQVPSTGEKVSTNKELNEVANKLGVSLAQVLIAWGIQRGYAVLPKSSNPERIRSNAKLIQLSDEDFEKVNKVAAGRRTRFVNMKDTFGYDVWPEESNGVPTL